MATLKKHGREVGRLEYLTYTVAVMEDGKLLRNQGNGWKIYRKCKAGVTPEQVVANRAEFLNKNIAEAPCYWAYKNCLHREVSLKHRFLVHDTISSMPQDPDGCWSELSDAGYFRGSLSDMVELCELFTAMEDELRRRAQAKEIARHDGATGVAKT